MKYKSINFLNNYFNDIIDNECKNMIINLGKNKNVDSNTLMDEFYNDDFKSYYKDKINNLINQNVRCLGLIKSGCQCLRSRQNNSSYCRIHQKTLKFGKKFN